VGLAPDVIFAAGAAATDPLLQATRKLGQSRVIQASNARSLPRSRRRGGARLNAQRF
jgi:hypothetical protein